MTKQNILVIQYGDDSNGGQAHEQICFKASGVRAGFGSDALVWDFVDICAQDFNLAGDKARSYHKIVLAGSVEHSATESDPRFVICAQRTQQVLESARQENIPVLGIVFGAQMMVAVSGGVVKSDINKRQSGTYETSLTMAGQLDDLFHDMTSPFLAQYGNHDHIAELGKDWIHLAQTEINEIAGFKHQEDKMWGVMFHPALNLEAILARHEMHPDDKEMAKELKRTFQAAPQQLLVIKNFLEM